MTRRIKSLMVGYHVMLHTVTCNHTKKISLNIQIEKDMKRILEW